MAKGEYFHLIASDDSDEPEAIKTLYEFLSKNKDYGLAVGDNYIMNDAGKRCFWDKKLVNVYKKDEAEYLTFGDRLKHSRRDINFDSEEFGSYESLLIGNYIPNGYLIRKSIIDEIGGYSDNAPLEDYYLMMQISKISKLKFIDKPLFNYRWHSSNTIKQTEKMKKISIETILQEEKYAKTNGYEKSFLRGIGYKKCYGIPFLLDFVYNEKSFKKEFFIRVLGIKVISYKRKPKKKVVKFLYIPAYKRKVK